ncbi:MAG: BatD family protein, partial [Muribaculaceae bacterium]|nr:BatD family protein [Muribaculaceae bacterium]
MKRFIKSKIAAAVLTLLALIAFAMPGYAADVSFTVNAPRQVVEGNQFKISYVLQNAEGTTIKVAEIEGASLLYGPAISTSHNVEIRYGKRTSTYTQQYTYTYRALKAGKYTVEPATVMVDGKAMKSKSFTLEILPPDQTVQNGGSQSQTAQLGNAASQRAGQTVSANDIFVRINLSKSHVYEQEALICSIKLYTKYQISSFMSTQQPSFNGFLIEEIPNNANLNDIEHYNGQNYMVAELRKFILYPQESGQLTITSGNYDVAVIQYEETSSFFGMMRTPVEKQIKVQSNQATLNVTPLPSLSIIHISEPTKR